MTHTSPSLLRRTNAAAYVRERYGFPCSTSWLAKLAVVGGGPAFRRAGRYPLYSVTDLDSWAKARMSRVVRSTAEFA